MPLFFLSFWVSGIGFFSLGIAYTFYIQEFCSSTTNKKDHFVKYKSYRKKQDKIFYKDSWIFGIDIDTYEVLDNGYSKDKNTAYKGQTPIVGSDGASFETLGSGLTGFWQRDKNTYYYKGKPIEGVDRDSFEILTNGYSKDKNVVYYKHRPIKGSDPKTFKQSRSGLEAEDKNNKYKKGRIYRK